jgi:hypothetical protein
MGNLLYITYLGNIRTHRTFEKRVFRALQKFFVNLKRTVGIQARASPWAMESRPFGAEMSSQPMTSRGKEGFQRAQKREEPELQAAGSSGGEWRNFKKTS